MLSLAALCGVGYGILGVAAADSRAQKASCGPAGAPTVVADRVARIYQVPTGHSPLGTFYNYYGCTVGNAKTQLLATSALGRVRVFSCVASECGSVRAIRLRGAKVGLIVDRHGVDTGSSTLTVRDLAGGHVLHTVQANWVIGYGDSLITYVLAPSGNVAWATERRSPDFGPDGTIHRAIGHAVTTLDKGPANRIRASSLRLPGDVLSWTDGGQHRHASLP